MSQFRVAGTDSSELRPAEDGAGSGHRIDRTDRSPGEEVGVELVFPQKPQARRADGPSGRRCCGSREVAHLGRPSTEELAELVGGVKEQTTERSHLC